MAADTVKPQPQQPLSNRPMVEDDNRTLDNIQGFFEANKKLITYGATAIIVVVAGVLAYFFLYKGPREEKAANRVFHAQQYFMADSLDKALKGDGQHAGFLKIIRDFSGTKTANLAHYYAGVSYLKLGNAKEAIKHLEDFDGEGTMVETAANGKLGDAYMETGNVKKGISFYEKAISNENDVVQTPMYLFNLAAAYEQNKQPEQAIKAYKRIRDEFPTSMQARDADRYLARLGELE